VIDESGPALYQVVPPVLADTQYVAEPDETTVMPSTPGLYDACSAPSVIPA